MTHFEDMSAVVETALAQDADALMGDNPARQRTQGDDYDYRPRVWAPTFDAFVDGRYWAFQ